MKHIIVDIAVIGGGPAGMAAALEAYNNGIEKVLILERDIELGGILRQCIHDGFGIHRFGKRLSGNQYAQSFIDEVLDSNIDVRLETMVLDINSDKVIYACNQKEGMLRIECGAIILAMGCRERTGAQVLLYGDRPAGVMTAGSVQRYINMEGYLPGKTAVILGSGDIGLIMARRMTLEGIEVKGVFEAMSTPGGLTRNIVQCLDDYEIPLRLSSTVTWVHGRKRLEYVTVADVDENRNPIAGTQRDIKCDLLVLAVGLIPENELSLKAGIEMDMYTKGPILDENFMTSIPGIFAAGNVAAVFDLVDYVSQSGEIAARGAIRYLNNEIDMKMKYCRVLTCENIGVIVPQRVHSDIKGEEGIVFFLRVKKPARRGDFLCMDGKTQLMKKRCHFVSPPEMLSFSIKPKTVDELMISMVPEIEEGVAEL